jgi:phosphoglycerate dehydrogenase-like enzyme
MPCSSAAPTGHTPQAPVRILLNRPLPPLALETLHAIAPRAELRHETRSDALKDSLNWAEVIFGNPPTATLRNLPGLRWLQIVSSGFDEYSFLEGQSVVVTTAHGVHTAAIAQHVLMAMLMFARGQLHFGTCQQAAKWDRNPAVPFSLAGQTVGFIGYGLIAQELARFGRLLGLRMIAVKRTVASLPAELERLDSLDGLDALLDRSDHVVVTLPLTSETKGVIDARRVALIKPGAYFYNVARGGLVNESALRQRLKAGTLGGAAMDVFTQEPLPSDNPWWQTPRTLIHPHIAGHHRDLNVETFRLFADNLGRYIHGQPLRNIADFRRGY